VPDEPTIDIDPTSVHRAAGAAAGLTIVALTWNVNSFSGPGRQWAAAATILLGAVLVEALPILRRALPWPGASPATLLAALIAAALCVPETDQFPVAALLPGMLLVAELTGRRQLGLEWYAVAAASVAWGAVFGASGRQSALVGAMFSWWPVLLPVGVLVLVESQPSRCPSHAARRRVSAIAAAVGAVAAMVVARTGALADTGGPAVLAVAVAITASVGAIGVALRLAGTDEDPAGSAAPIGDR
jgi:hypothetical protein